MWHDEVIDIIERGHDRALDYAIEDCLGDVYDEKIFEYEYKSYLMEYWQKAEKILLQIALEKFREANDLLEAEENFKKGYDLWI